MPGAWEACTPPPASSSDPVPMSAFLSPSLPLGLCLSLAPSLSVSLSPPVSLSLSLSLCLCLSVSLYVSLCVSVCLCLSLHLCLSVSVSLPLSPSISLSLSLSLCLCLSVSLCLSLTISLSVSPAGPALQSASVQEPDVPGSVSGLFLRASTLLRLASPILGVKVRVLTAPSMIPTRLPWMSYSGNVSVIRGVAWGWAAGLVRGWLRWSPMGPPLVAPAGRPGGATFP